MRNVKKIKSFLIFFIVIASLYHLESTSDDGTTTLPIKKNIVIDPYFKSLVIALVEHMIVRDLDKSLPNRLLECYEQFQENKTEGDEHVLQEAFCDILSILEMMKKESRYNADAFFNSLNCDLSEVTNYLNKEIYSLFSQCCANNSSNFNQTFTVLFDIESTLTACCESITNNFNSTFTILAQNQNDLATCCENVTNDFQATYSVIAYGFGSTYTILDDNFNTIFFDLTTDLNELNELLGDISSCFNTLRVTYSICCYEIENLITTLDLTNGAIIEYGTQLNNISSRSACLFDTFVTC